MSAASIVLISAGSSGLSATSRSITLLVLLAGLKLSRAFSWTTPQDDRCYSAACGSHRCRITIGRAPVLIFRRKSLRYLRAVGVPVPSGSPGGYAGGFHRESYALYDVMTPSLSC